MSRECLNAAKLLSIWDAWASTEDGPLGVSSDTLLTGQKGLPSVYSVYSQLLARAESAWS